MLKKSGDIRTVAQGLGVDKRKKGDACGNPKWLVFRLKPVHATGATGRGEGPRGSSSRCVRHDPSATEMKRFGRATLPTDRRDKMEVHVVSTSELHYSGSDGKVLNRRNMRASLADKRPCPGFPQPKAVLSTRFPQNLWINLGKSGKVPKIRVKSNGLSSYDSLGATVVLEVRMRRAPVSPALGQVARLMSHTERDSWSSVEGLCRAIRCPSTQVFRPTSGRLRIQYSCGDPPLSPVP